VEARLEAVTGAAVEHVVLEDELDRAIPDVDQPVVVAPSRPRALEAVALLLQARGHLDVAGPGHPLELRADPDRVAHVLQRVGAHGEVEPVVGEGPRLAGTDVHAVPGGGVEAIAPAAVAAVQAAGLIGHQVEHLVGPGERPSPAAHVEHAVAGAERGLDPVDAGPEHGPEASTHPY